MALVTVQRSPTPSTTSSPCASEADSGEEECRSQPRSISESFLTVKGAALFLPRGNGSSTPRISHRRNKHAGDLQQHLQAMFILLRPEDNIRLAVRLESTYQNRTRYMVVVSTNGRQDTEESIVLGMDFSSNDSSTCTMGLVLPLWSDTLIHLDGDGGFSVSTDNRVHIFKPVSVQAMWSALQSLHKACEVARLHNYYPGSLFLTWVSYYESHINSDQSSVNEWNAMQDVQSHRPDSPALFTDIPTERERTERLIKTKLREIMMQKDLENITSKEIRTELEMQMVCNLREFKEFIDNEMIVILGQMDSPTQIFEHVFLGSEWNASNLEDLQNRGVRYILNVTREIDNFFPGVFEYHNIRVYDEEATDLLAYWNDTYKFISKAKKHGSKCLVHCKMGVSRSASTVIAYAMKEYGWNLDRAYDYVKERRTVTKPNPSFMRQLEEYQGILLARTWHDFIQAVLFGGWEDTPGSSTQKESVDLQGQILMTFLDSIRRRKHVVVFPKRALLLTFLSPMIVQGTTAHLNEGGSLLWSKQRHNKLWRSHSDSDLSDHHEPICKPGLELNKKEITTSADQITEVKTMESHPSIPPVFVEHVPQEENQKGLCTKERMICLEFTSREFCTEQIEDELNLNDINGCCLNEANFPLDNCHASKALSQPGQVPEMANKFPDLTVEDLETDALKADINVHLLPMEELTSRLKDLPMSPDPESPSPQPSCQVEVSDFSTDRIDFFSALEKFVELSQETRTRTFSHSRMEELAGGRSESCRLSVEVTPCEGTVDDQRSSSLSNTPHASEESSIDEEQSKAIPELVSPDIVMQCHSENAISVKEIITEIESISQGVGQNQLKGDILSNPCHTPKKNSVQELPLERTQSLENKPESVEQNEDSCTTQPELAKDSGKGEPESYLTPHVSTTDLDEEEAEGDQELGGPEMHPSAKWCPGSVRRATLEFEERLRQEHEHHGTASACTSLSTRKNSKNDYPVADLPLKGKSDETTLEHSLVPKELEMSKDKGKHGGAESDSLPHSEQNALVPTTELQAPHPSPVPQESPGSDAKTKQEGVLKEQRILVSCQGSEIWTAPLPLPKKIEIIEYTHTETSPDYTGAGQDIATPKKSGEQATRKVKVEKTITVFCALDENLNRTLGPQQVSLHPKVLPLPPPSSPEHNRCIDLPPAISSSEDGGHSPSTTQDTAAPFVSHTTHVPSASLDYLHPQTVVRLEGFTEQSSTTDCEPPTEQGCGEDRQECHLSGSKEMSYRGSQQNNEDLSLISKLGDSIGNLEEKLEPSSGACQLSHSSGSDNIKGVSHSPSVVKERTKEIESRVTCQAGARPSKIKRSMSLAKLGYLDLCKDCLSERECVCSESPHLKLLQPFLRTDSGIHTAQEPPQNPDASQNPEPTKYFVEQLKTAECIVQSKPVEKPLVQYAKEFGYSKQCLLPGAGLELTSSEGGLPLLQTQGLPGAVPAPRLAVAPRQQHGRTHPLRRLKKANDKKRTTNPFYNTM